MRLVLAVVLALACHLSAPRRAVAEPAELGVTAAGASGGDATTAIGVRVGGYGFRREGDPRPGSGWTECRMNGLGLFVDHALGHASGPAATRGPLFVEAGLDVYFTQDLIASSPSTDLPIDRMSGLVSGAIGARTALTPRLRAYAQLGGGVELTRVAVPYGTDGTVIRANKALPEGFFGIGGDVRVARSTYVGMTVRVLVMGSFNYAASRLQMANPWVAAPSADDVFAASPDLALQGQFYVRRGW